MSKPPPVTITLEARTAERERIIRSLGEHIEQRLPDAATDDLIDALYHLRGELKKVDAAD